MNAVRAVWLAVSMSVTGGTLAAANSDEIFLNGFEQFTLTIDNYLDWCTIQENGSPYSASMTFSQGTVVDLFAGPASPVFVWGYWTGTDGDKGAGDTNPATTVTMSTDRSVLACCPFASNPTMKCE